MAEEHAAEKEALAPLLADGFDHHEHEHLKPGIRVRNAGERYDAARQFGTAEIVAVLRKPGAWEQKYGRLNIEVLVRRDDDGSLGWWADYGTVLPEGCWACGGSGRTIQGWTDKNGQPEDQYGPCARCSTRVIPPAVPAPSTEEHTHG